MKREDMVALLGKLVAEKQENNPEDIETWTTIDDLEIVSDFIKQLPDRYFEKTIFPGGGTKWT